MQPVNLSIEGIKAMGEEKWKDVNGYEGFYQVSNLGRVRSLDRHLERKGTGKGSGLHFYKGQVLKPTTNSVGYPCVSLGRNGKNKVWNVHALVTQAFLGDRPKGFQVNHIDGDKLNNQIKNLEYCSARDNIRHAHKLGLSKGLKGESSRNSKLKAADIQQILKMLKEGTPQRKIAKAFGVHQSTISLVKTGKAWN